MGGVMIAAHILLTILIIMLWVAVNGIPMSYGNAPDMNRLLMIGMSGEMRDLHVKIPRFRLPRDLDIHEDELARDIYDFNENEWCGMGDEPEIK
jgi:hypothetical protein